MQQNDAAVWVAGVLGDAVVTCDPDSYAVGIRGDHGLQVAR